MALPEALGMTQLNHLVNTCMCYPFFSALYFILKGRINPTEFNYFMSLYFLKRLLKSRNIFINKFILFRSSIHDDYLYRIPVYCSSNTPWLLRFRLYDKLVCLNVKTHLHLQFYCLHNPWSR